MGATANPQWRRARTAISICLLIASVWLITYWLRGLWGGWKFMVGMLGVPMAGLAIATYPAANRLYEEMLLSIGFTIFGIGLGVLGRLVFLFHGPI
jgi:hypothetical protein